MVIEKGMVINPMLQTDPTPKSKNVVKKLLATDRIKSAEILWLIIIDNQENKCLVVGFDDRGWRMFYSCPVIPVMPDVFI